MSSCCKRFGMDPASCGLRAGMEFYPSPSCSGGRLVVFGCGEEQGVEVFLSSSVGDEWTIGSLRVEDAWER